MSENVGQQQNDSISLVQIFQRRCQMMGCNSISFSVCDSDSELGVNSISYPHAFECLQHHVRWLTMRIEQLRRMSRDLQDITVAILSDNSTDMLLSLLASTSLSSVFPDLTPVTALLHVRWSPEEMAKSLTCEKPARAGTIIIFGNGFKNAALDLCQKLNHASLYVPLQSFSTRFFCHSSKETSNQIALSSAPSTPFFSMSDLETHGDTSDAIVVFTSGTTGGSKGVRLSHRAIAVQAFSKMDDPCKYTFETAMLATTVPFFHIAGISSSLAVLFAGGKLIFPHSSDVRYSPQLTINSLSHSMAPSNTLVMVPAMLVSLLSKIEDEQTTYPGVKLILIGGQSAPKPMLESLFRVFPNVRLVQTFACTEAASSLTFLKLKRNPELSPNERTEDTLNGDCVGSPPRHIKLRLYQKDGVVNKIIHQPYIPGVIATLGPHIMNGYWARGSLSQKDVEGWFVTSDLGYFDRHGQLYFCGRTRDTIRTGGETVMAQEVERVLLRNPKIVECAVFARPDERFGEAVACALVTLDKLDLNFVKHWCRSHGLANYKCPRYIYIVNALPRNTSGKVLKHILLKKFGKVQSKL